MDPTDHEARLACARDDLPMSPYQLAQRAKRMEGPRPTEAAIYHVGASLVQAVQIIDGSTCTSDLERAIEGAGELVRDALLNKEL